MKLEEKLMKICEELEDAKWLGSKCRLPTSDGYIDVKLKDGDLEVKRKYDVKAPWDSAYMTIILKNVENIKKTEQNGIEAQSDNAYLHVYSKWIPSSYAWGPHYRSHIYAYDKKLIIE